MRRKVILSASVLLAVAGWTFFQTRRAAAAQAVAPSMVYQELPQGGKMAALMVGHEYREDDLPSIAKSPDGSLWVAWLSWVGDHDDIAIRHYVDGQWSNIHWVPNTSGDSWLPQIAVDAANCPVVVWSQQVKGNWDIYARRFDPAGQDWGKLEQLTTNPLPDINPRLTANGQGKMALVWQSFRGRNCNIFYKSFDGEKWLPEVRVTNRPANDWEPSVALDSKGVAWIAYDSYNNGNYDVFLSRVAGGHLEGAEIPVATTPLFETRATVAIDTLDRVWVAWEQGSENWGKDNGLVIRDRQKGVGLGGKREPQIRCYQNGGWREPALPLSSALKGNTYEPHVFSDGKGSVWVAASRHLSGGAGFNANRTPMGYWEYWLTHFDGENWSEAFPLPRSKGRCSTRINAVLANDGALWLAWPTDNRVESFYHRPLRQQIYAGSVPAPKLNHVAELPVAKSGEATKADVVHPDEKANIAALRAYTVVLDGKAAHLLRGDFHRHTELSWDGGGSGDGSLQDFYRYMIDAAAWILGLHDHQGGEWPYWWWYSQKMTDMYHVPGAYTSIFGYERSTTYPFGHHNVFFANVPNPAVSCRFS